MSILFECVKCSKRNTLQTVICVCGEKFIPQGAIYWIDVRGKDRKKFRRKLGKVSLSVARRAEAELKVLVTTEVAVNDLCWSDLVTRFCSKLEAEGRTRQYRIDSYRYLNEMGDFWGRGRKIDTITPILFQEFRVSLLNKNMSKNTIDRYHSAAKACWKYTVEDKPCPFSRTPLFRPDDGDVGFLTNGKVNLLLQAALKTDETVFQMLVVALATGLRKMNVVHLKREDVDFKEGAISIIQKRGRRHVVRLASSVTEMLTNIPDNGTPYFWINPKTGLPYTTFPRKKWAIVKKKAGIEKDFRFHSIRHTSAANIYQVTGDIKAVQEILGHTSFKTSSRYIHVFTDQFKAIAEKIDPLRNMVT
jgi:integrase